MFVINFKELVIVIISVTLKWSILLGVWIPKLLIHLVIQAFLFWDISSACFLKPETHAIIVGQVYYLFQIVRSSYFQIFKQFTYIYAFIVTCKVFEFIYVFKEWVSVKT